MKIIIIAAIGKNGELGKDNDLIWHIKEDLTYFKNVTTSHNILMGKNTFVSLGRLLPNRHHILISSTTEEMDEVEIFRSMEEFFEAYKLKEEDVYVIGGGRVYSEFLPYAEEMHLTEIDDTHEADTYFPTFNKDDYEKEIVSEFTTPIPYKHVLYKRKDSLQ